MAKKIEHIEQLLQSKDAKREVNQAQSDKETTYVTIRTSTGVYKFIESDKCSDGSSFDGYKDIERTRKNLERKIQNRLNWGAEGGRAEVCRDNKTCKALAELKANEHLAQEGRYLKLMAQWATQAPVLIRPYVFLNLYDRLGDDGVKLNIQTNYDVAFSMPMAWAKGVGELHHFDGLRLQTEISNLVPKFQKGDRITVRSKKQGIRDYECTVNEPIFKQYYQKPFRNKWGNTEYKGEGPWVVWYATNYGHIRYDEIVK